MDKIILNNVSKNIKGAQVLKNISLEFYKGRIYGLYGYNGSGKTMLLRMVAGLIRPTEGEVYIDSKVMHKDMDFPENIGVMIENPNLWNNYTGKEALYSLARINCKIGFSEIDDALRRVNLDPEDKRIIKKYSLGMKKRLGIAQAIMEKPEILLLDEPSNALDKIGTEMVHNIILEEKEKGTLIILASHQKEDLKICDEVIEIEAGQVIEGVTDEEKNIVILNSVVT